ncbi:integrase catalytic domain-containing protein [Trichonephila clavipes]|nr:integrase catalytic domain-containing protein [Trichonephila clavipes]
MDKLNNSKRAIKGTITKIETFVEASGNHTPTKLDFKMKRVQEMNRKIDELKDQYYDIKDISESELQVIEADIQSMEDRLEELEGAEDQLFPCKAILDSGSHLSFIRQRLANKLPLKKEKINASISGLREITLRVKQKVNTVIQNKNGDFSTPLELLIVPYITTTSIHRMDATKVNIPSNIDLADKDFGSFDKFEDKSYCGLAINAEINSDTLNQQLQVFWEIEKVDESSIEHSLEEEICETQYQNTHYRTEEGRYVVQLPLKRSILFRGFYGKTVLMVMYKLNTVTYGTTCAPYLATRTIQQLARDEGEHYPLAASVTIRDIYKDDILTGSSNFQEFQILQLELISLFKKWEKAELLSMDLPTAQQQHMVLYYMLNRSQKRMYLQDSLCSKSRVAPVKPITIPRLELCCLCVIVTAPGKGFIFLDATYTANNAMD